MGGAFAVKAHERCEDLPCSHGHQSVSTTLVIQAFEPVLLARRHPPFPGALRAGGLHLESLQLLVADVRLSLRVQVGEGVFL